MIDRLSENHTKILCNLAVFKFLTEEQMLFIGIYTQQSNLSKALGELRSIKLVDKVSKKVGVKAIFYLTLKGARLVTEKFDFDAHYPKSRSVSTTQDEQHRLFAIDFQIAIYGHSEMKNIVFFDRYFDKTGNQRVEKNLRSKTGIKFSKGTLKADAAFLIQTQKQKELYLVEIENGIDKKKSAQKIRTHSIALMEGAVNKRYNFQAGYRVLVIFESESNMHKTLDLIKDNGSLLNLTEYFLCKTVEEAKRDVYNGWLNLDKKERKLYYT